VIRIERSRRYRVALSGDAPAPPQGGDQGAVATAFAPLVHDRMTECVYKV